MGLCVATLMDQLLPALSWRPCSSAAPFGARDPPQVREAAA